LVQIAKQKDRASRKLRDLLRQCKPPESSPPDRRAVSGMQFVSVMIFPSLCLHDMAHTMFSPSQRPYKGRWLATRIGGQGRSDA
jgi:hypothetical protein